MIDLEDIVRQEIRAGLDTLRAELRATQGRPADSPRFYTVKGVAERLGLSEWSVHEKIRTGELKSILVGRSRRIGRHHLQAYLDGAEEGSA